MPNWVKTIVKTKPEVLSEVLKNYSDNEGKFSFDKVIPMPKELDIEDSSMGEEGLMFLYLDSKDDLYKSKINETYHSLNMFYDDIYKGKNFFEIKNNFDKYKTDYLFKKNIELGKKYLDNYEKYGYATWYDWCTYHWGTKWDLCQFQHNKDTMIFMSAWEFAEPVFLELSSKIPNATFLCEYADELIAENSGILKIKNGKIIESEFELNNTQIEEIWGTYVNEYEFNEDMEEEIEK